MTAADSLLPRLENELCFYVLSKITHCAKGVYQYLSRKRPMTERHPTRSCKGTDSQPTVSQHPSRAVREGTRRIIAYKGEGTRQNGV